MSKKLFSVIICFAVLVSVMVSNAWSPVAAQELDAWQLNEERNRIAFTEEIKAEKEPDAINLLITSFIDGEWYVTISPKDVSPSWEQTDKISIPENKYRDSTYQENNDILIHFNKDVYKTGHKVWLVVQNKTKKVEKEIFVNFTKLDKPSFPTWGMALANVASINRVYYTDEDVFVDTAAQKYEFQEAGTPGLPGSSSYPNTPWDYNTNLSLVCSATGGKHVLHFGNATEETHELICEACHSVGGHSHGWICTNNGETGHIKKCGGCGYVFGELEHAFRFVQDGEKGHYKMCVNCGYKTGESRHGWITCDGMKMCGSCGYSAK